MPLPLCVAPQPTREMSVCTTLQHDIGPCASLRIMTVLRRLYVQTSKEHNVRLPSIPRDKDTISGGTLVPKTELGQAISKGSLSSRIPAPVSKHLPRKAVDWMILDTLLQQ